MRGEKGLTLEEKFIKYAPIFKDKERCWEWAGTTSSKDYGFIHAEGKSVLAHRYSYEHFREPIPKGYIIDHIICDNPICCNPWHLKLCSTHWENVRRGSSPAAQNARKTCCPQCGRKYVIRTYYGKLEGRQGRMCSKCDNHQGNPKQPPRRRPQGVGVKKTHCPKDHKYTEENSL